VTIYRLENYRGTGVYRLKGDEINEILDRYEGCNHPLPEKDALLVANLKKNGIEIKPFSWYKKFCFGFSSLAQLELWFNCDWDLDALWSLGVGIGVYEIEKVYIGYSQALFGIEYKNLDNRKFWDSIEEVKKHEIASNH
jgi:hypothetical protein